MNKRKRAVPLFDGTVIAHGVHRFVRAGLSFDVIRPGYDTQGVKRQTWTQIVHDGVPIYEKRQRTELANVLDHFDQMWEKWIGDDEDVLARALAAVKKERQAKFRDGESGVAPAPSLTLDERPHPVTYPA